MLTFGIRSPKSFAAFDGIVLFGLLAMTARSATDPDIGWHLRTGQWIAATGHVPRFDPFSFTRAGHAWVAHEWLSEVIFYHRWIPTPLPTLCCHRPKTSLGRRRHRPRRFGCRPRLGRTPPDVYLSPRQSAAVADRGW